jgi:branched-subunit amino acid ABC-type transport system permease component
MGRTLLSIALLAGLSGVAFGQTAPASEIAPGGKLRVGMIAITVLGGVAEPVGAQARRSRTLYRTRELACPPCQFFPA